MRKKADLLADIEVLEEQVSELKRRVREIESGARQMNEAMNSILMYFANKNGGTITIPKDHFKITKNMAFSVGEDISTKSYIFSVKEVEE